MGSASNRRFEKLKQSFFVVHVDTLNGKGEFVERLDLQRNRSYILLLRQNANRTINGEHPYEEFVRLTNPKSLDKILGLCELFIDRD